MLTLLVKRLFATLLLVVLVSFAVFVLVDLSPTDPARRVAGDTAAPEVVERIHQSLGLDKSLLVRYGQWMGDAVRGDLGESIVNGGDVRTVLGRGIPVTASLVFLALVFSVPAGVALGLLATNPNKLVSGAISVLTALAIATPVFWLARYLIELFSFRFTWFPPLGYEPMREGVLVWLKSLVLPALSLSALFGAEVTRQLEASMGDELAKQHVLAARARGIKGRTIVTKYALKNAAQPVVTITGFRVAQLIGGTVLIEKVFGLNGVGSLAVDAALGGDVSLVLGVTVMTLLVVAIVNLIVDLSYGLLDPRSRAL